MVHMHRLIGNMQVTAPEDLAVKITIESTLFQLPPSYVDRLQPALEYMTYGTAQARDRHFLAWYASPQGTLFFHSELIDFDFE